jgi:hypothetical protein
MQLKTQTKTGNNATKLADEYISHECGVLQAIKRRNCSEQINLSKTQTPIAWQLLIIKDLGMCKYPLDATLMG